MISALKREISHGYTYCLRNLLSVPIEKKISEKSNMSIGRLCKYKNVKFLYATKNETILK